MMLVPGFGFADSAGAPSVPEPSFVNVPGNSTEAEGGESDFGSLSIVYGGASTLVCVLSVSASTGTPIVSAPDTSGATVVSNDSGMVTITGSKAQIEAEIAAAIIDLLDATGTASVSMQLKRESEVEFADEENFEITVTPAEPSFASVQSTANVAEDALLEMSAVTFTYAGASDLRAVIAASGGIIVSVTEGTGATVSNNDSSSVTIVGTKTQIEACLANTDWTIDATGVTPGPYALNLGIRRDGELTDHDTETIDVTVTEGGEAGPLAAQQRAAWPRFWKFF